MENRSETIENISRQITLLEVNPDVEPQNDFFK